MRACLPNYDWTNRRKRHEDFFATTADLRRKENFPCVRVFYLGSGRKTGDVDVAAIWRERTCDQPWFSGDRRSIEQVSFLLIRV
jgi:hypothetical protein